MNDYDFHERLAFSVASHGRPFESIICDTIPGIVSVVKTNTEIDKTGVDYIATLRRGSQINIDVKLRDIGCSKYWRNGEELALETWSVVPNGTTEGKAGWTLDESKNTHYTLHAFHPSDSDTVFILPFQLLRKAFRKHKNAWCSAFKVARQNSVGWTSECVFVPASSVLIALNDAMICPSSSPDN